MVPPPEAFLGPCWPAPWVALAFTSPLGGHQREQCPLCPQSSQEGHCKRRRPPTPQPSTVIAGQSCPTPFPAVLLAGPPVSSVAPGWLPCTPAPSQDQLSHAGPTSRSRGHYVWSTNPGQSFTGRRPSSLAGRAAHSRAPAPAPEMPTPTQLWQPLRAPRCDAMPPLPGPLPGPALPAASPPSLRPGFCVCVFPPVFQLCPLPSAFSASSLPLALLPKDGGSAGSPCREGHPEDGEQSRGSFQRLLDGLQSPRVGRLAPHSGPLWA